MSTGPTAEDGEPIRTLFISGLPPDVKEREVHNLFRPFPGYSGSSIKPGPKQSMAFSWFIDQASANVAKDALNSIHFDPASSLTLHIEFAKHNSKIKGSNPSVEFFSQEQTDKRLRAAMELGYHGIGAPGVVPAGFYGADMASLYSSGLMPGFIDPTLNPYMMRYYGQQASSKGDLLAPCTTLFVGNLGVDTTETELLDLFSRCPGFKRLHVQPTSKGAPPVCFVDFQDVQFSTHVLQSLQGFNLKTSEKGGIRIEYAKHRMGEASKKNPRA
jgi:RNA recognition motif-containing protein